MHWKNTTACLLVLLVSGVIVSGCAGSSSGPQSGSRAQTGALVEGVHIAGSFDELSYCDVQPYRVQVTVRAANIGTADAENVNALVTIRTLSSDKILGTARVNFGTLAAGGGPKVITTTVPLDSYVTGYMAYLSSDTPGTWLSEKKN